MEIFVSGLGSPLRTAVHEEACLNKRLRPQFHGHGESCPIKKKKKKRWWFVPTKADGLFRQGHRKQSID